MEWFAAMRLAARRARETGARWRVYGYLYPSGPGTIVVAVDLYPTFRVVARDPRAWRWAYGVAEARK